VFFGRTRTKPDASAVTRAEFDNLCEKVTRLAGRVDQVVADGEVHAKEQTNLRLEWAEIMGKIVSWSNRQSARDRKRASNLLSGEPEQTELPAVVPGERSKEELRKIANQRFGIGRRNVSGNSAG